MFGGLVRRGLFILKEYTSRTIFENKNGRDSTQLNCHSREDRTVMVWNWLGMKLKEEIDYSKNYNMSGMNYWDQMSSTCVIC